MQRNNRQASPETKIVIYMLSTLPMKSNLYALL